MGGPRLHSNSAQCLFEKAKTVPEADADGKSIIDTYTGDYASFDYVRGMTLVMEAEDHVIFAETLLP